MLWVAVRTRIPYFSFRSAYQGGVIQVLLRKGGKAGERQVGHFQGHRFAAGETDALHPEHLGVDGQPQGLAYLVWRRDHVNGEYPGGRPSAGRGSACPP